MSWSGLRIPGVLASGAIDGLPFPGVVSGNGYQVEAPDGENSMQVMARNHRVSRGTLPPWTSPFFLVGSWTTKGPLLIPFPGPHQRNHGPTLLARRIAVGRYHLVEPACPSA